jgi:aminopeptidase N
MKKISYNCLFLFVFGLLSFVSHAQSSFQSADNMHYWKNKKPFEGYWQQDVAYKIKANIDETTDIITGEEQLTYTNNSPDTLYFVYFNLYQNAFLPGSYLDDLQKNNGIHPSYGKYESSQQGIVIEKMFSGSTELKTQLDNTILKVFLPKPLLPNQSTPFDIQFRTFYDSGSTRRRMKKYRAFGYTHYNGCQWYPKLCVYDRKSGWNTDQHLNREFYGDYGSFDVALTFAANFVVEATGTLQNEKEVLPDSLKQKLQISNFKDKKWDEKPSIITPYKKDKRKTWLYHADNVHDFAFTADPSYRIADTFWNGVRCVAICQEPHAAGWQTAAQYCAKIIKCFSEDFGMYNYPKMVVADAADGMEYPMLTLDGGRDPEYRGLLVHEVGHNWFYGMLGNNETYRAMMDEGFTQFLTAWGLEHIDGDTMVHEPIKNKYVRHFAEPTNVRDSKVYLSYLSDAIQYNDEPLNTHSDGFNGALGQGGGYRHVYAKTSTMLYNLQYVLGDSLFQSAMKHYVQQWKFCHPYPEDFRNSISQFTHADLNWFFDEWMETTKNVDYKTGKIKKTALQDKYEITLKRKGRMQMPIDLRVVSKKDSVYDFFIPNTWFEKSFHCDTLTTHNSQPTTLSKWYGWDKLKPTYTAEVTIPGGIKNVIIDPSERLADIDMQNNRKKGNVIVKFDSHIYSLPSWKKYVLYLRPDLWWNNYDGFKVGLHAEGNYMQIKNNFVLNVWLNTHLLQGINPSLTKDEKRKADWVSYSLTVNHAIDKIIKKGTIHIQSKLLDGLELYELGLSKRFGDKWLTDISIKAFNIPQPQFKNYLLYPNEWKIKQWNSSLNLSASYSYQKQNVSGKLQLKFRSSAFLSNYNYHYLELIHTQKATAWKLDFRTRLYARAGLGSNPAPESQLYFAGANPEEMSDNKYLRATGFVPHQWLGYGTDINHFQYGGGMNMRGYSGYLLGETDKNGVVMPTYKGNSGIALNAEIDFNKIFVINKIRASKFATKLREIFSFNSYLFGDVGSIVYTNSLNKQQFSQVRVDAGVGAAITIKKWWVLQNIKPLTIRFDVPFFVSCTPYSDPAHFKFRWVIGISRTF